MSFYVTSPFKPTPTLATAGFPVYLFGAYNDRVGSTLGYVISDSLTSDVATVNFQIVSGNAPIVGALVTIQGSANNSGAFNVVNASILSVSTTNTGVCTITFAVTAGNSSLASDGGQIIVPQPETADDVTNAQTTTPSASIPVSRPYNNPNIQQGMSISASIMFPVVHAGAQCIVMLQGAIQDLDSNYQDIGPLVGSFSGSTSGAAVPEALIAGQEYTFQTGTYTGYTSDSFLSDTYPGYANLPNFRFFRLKFYNVASFGVAANSTTAIGKLQF